MQKQKRKETLTSNLLFFFLACSRHCPPNTPCTAPALLHQEMQCTWACIGARDGRRMTGRCGTQISGPASWPGRRDDTVLRYEAGRAHDSAHGPGPQHKHSKNQKEKNDGTCKHFSKCRGRQGRSHRCHAGAWPLVFNVYRPLSSCNTKENRHDGNIHRQSLGRVMQIENAGLLILQPEAMACCVVGGPPKGLLGPRQQTAPGGSLLPNGLAATAVEQLTTGFRPLISPHSGTRSPLFANSARAK